MKRELTKMMETLMNLGVATEQELQLVIDICGFSAKTLNSVLYARTGFRYIQQFLGEDEEEDEYDEEKELE